MKEDFKGHNVTSPVRNRGFVISTRISTDSRRHGSPIKRIFSAKRARLCYRRGGCRCESPKTHITLVSISDLFVCFDFQLTQDASAEPAITVQIPPVLKEAAKTTDKVVCTFFQNNSLFQVSAPQHTCTRARARTHAAAAGEVSTGTLASVCLSGQCPELQNS